MGPLCWLSCIHWERAERVNLLTSSFVEEPCSVSEVSVSPGGCGLIDRPWGGRVLFNAPPTPDESFDNPNTDQSGTWKENKNSLISYVDFLVISRNEGIFFDALMRK